MAAIRYLENPYTGRYIRLLVDDGDWLWERGLAGCHLHVYEENSAEHTFFLLKNSDRIVEE